MATYSDREDNISPVSETGSDGPPVKRRNPNFVRLNLLALEVYFKDGRSARLLKTSHDRNFFSNEDWFHYQKRSASFLKKEVKLGEAKAFRMGKEHELGSHMISLSNGLSSLCITSRGDTNPAQLYDEEIIRTCLTAEGRLLNRVLENCLRKMPAELWAEESRKVFVDDQRIKYYEGHLNMILQEELDNLYKTKVQRMKEWTIRREKYRLESERREAHIAPTTQIKKKIVKWFEARA